MNPASQLGKLGKGKPKTMTPAAKRRPGRPDGITRTKVSVSLSIPTYKAARKAAFDAGMSFSAFAQAAIANGIKQTAKS